MQHNSHDHRPTAAESHTAETSSSAKPPPRFKDKADYAAALAKFAPYSYDEAAIAEHDADVARIIYGDPDLHGTRTATTQALREDDPPRPGHSSPGP